MRITRIFLCAAAFAAAFLGEAIAAESHRNRLFIAGDSTAADYPPARAPQIGWGQALPYFIDDDVEVINRAVNGRSTKSYIDEGRWAALLEEVGPGDFVLISFGHNDSRDDAPGRYAAPFGAYLENLKSFADDVAAAGAKPVIASPAARRLWEGPAMVETHGLYVAAASKAAQESGAAFIDLSNLTIAYFERLGPRETKNDYVWLTRLNWKTGEPETLEDNTHYSYLGACGVAYVLALALRQSANETFVRLVEALPDAETDGRPQAVHDCEHWARAAAYRRGAP